MLTPAGPFSYAAAVSGLKPAQPSDQVLDMGISLQKLHLKEAIGSANTEEQDSTISESTDTTSTAVEPIESPSHAKADKPDLIARIESPVSTNASVEDGKSHTTTSNNTSFNNVAAAREKTDKPAATDIKPVSGQPTTWASLTTGRQAPQGYDPLALIGFAKLGSLSPPRMRPSRFFPATEALLESEDHELKNNGVKKEQRIVSALANIGRTESPFFADGLCSGLAPGAQDLDYQRSTMGQSVDGFVDTHYASIPHRKMPALHLNAVQSSMRPAVEDSVQSTDQKFTSREARIDAKQQNEDDAGVLLAKVNEESTVHNPKATPFIPRFATTLANLEKAAMLRTDEQQTLTITRPKIAWEKVGDWRASNNRIPSTKYTMTSSSTNGAIGPQGSAPAYKPFRPMNAVLNPDASKQPLSPEELAFRQLHGISLNYQGNHDNPRNVSADIPNSLNASVWITLLPLQCTHRDLLRALAHYRPGRIWACHINPPVLDHHNCTAAKVTFYHPAEAQTLLRLARRGRGIEVSGQRIRAIHNKQRVPAATYSEMSSRAIEIAGDATLVNEPFLRGLFAAHFKWDEEEVRMLAEWDFDTGNVPKRAIEWRFGSMRAQAEAAYKLIRQQYPCLVVTYLNDPCAAIPDPDRQQLAEMDAAVVEYEAEMEARASNWDFYRSGTNVYRPPPRSLEEGRLASDARGGFGTARGGSRMNWN